MEFRTRTLLDVFKESEHARTVSGLAKRAERERKVPMIVKLTRIVLGRKNRSATTAKR